MNRLQQICDHLLLQIDRGDWPVGSRLPSERALASRYGVSRATLREALMLLKQQGALRSTAGSGHYVCERAEHQLPEPLLTDIQRFSHQELREFRVAIESQCAYLAAQRATPEQLKQIERAHQHLRLAHRRADLQAEGLADARFHLAIAEASGNRILAQSLRGLFALLRANVTQNIGSLAKRPETRLRLMRQHTALFESIYYGKAEKARATAAEHMAFVERILGEN